jgi:hypothetical protein
MGNASQGLILTGQVQGVKPGGAGIRILTDGTIEVDSQTIIGVMKMGQTAGSAAAAYNGYTWPATAGSPGQQLETNGTGILSWADADGIDWTLKGQLIVGTGVGTDILFNASSNRSFIVADTSTPSGLNYSDLIQTSVTIPTGTTVQRPASPVEGDLRLNTDKKKTEFFDGLIWQEIASGDPVPGGNTFVKESIPVSPTQTGNALIPSGDTTQRQTVPALLAGSTRFNTDFDQLEVWDGVSWAQLPASSNYDFVLQTRPPSGKTASAIIPPGATGQEEVVGVAGGWMRYNTTTNALEFYNGSVWELVAPSAGAVSSFVQSATPTAINTGDFWYDTAKQRESVWDGSSWVQPGVSQTSSTGAAFIPAGLVGVRPPGNIAGYFRLNTSTGKLEFNDGASWQEVASQTSPTPSVIGTVTSITAGAGLSGGTITTSGTISMPNVGPGGSYSLANITLDAQGRITAASSGSAGTVSSVDVSGGSTGMSFSGGPITGTGTITMGGVLGIGNGGTGGTTQPAAINNLLPGQGGQATKVLTTDGSNVSWQTGGGSGPTSVRAWLSFDGFTATIRDGNGFSSVTYLMQGYYQLNFSTPFTNSEYAVTIGVTDNDPGLGSYVNFGWINAFSRSTGGFVVRTAAAGAGERDSPNVSVMLADN